MTNSAFLRGKDRGELHAPSRPGAAVLKHFANVVVQEAADGGVLLSTSGFSKKVAEGVTEIEQRRMRLGNHTKIISLCKTYYKTDSEILDRREQSSIHFA